MLIFLLWLKRVSSSQSSYYGRASLVTSRFTFGVTCITRHLLLPRGLFQAITVLSTHSLSLNFFAWCIEIWVKIGIIVAPSQTFGVASSLETPSWFSFDYPLYGFCLASLSAVARKRSNSFFDNFFNVSDLLMAPKWVNSSLIEVSLAEKKAHEIDVVLASARVLNRKLILSPPLNDIPSTAARNPPN